MKKTLFLGCLFYSLISHPQTTHSVLVKVNQGSECPIVNSVQESEMIHVFPNPVTSVLNILSKSDNSELRIYNTQGSLAKKVFLKNGQQSINVKGLTPGIYILIVTSESEVQQLKIKIQ